MANAVFAGAPIVGGEQHANITGVLSDAANHLMNAFSPPRRLDLAPQPGKLMVTPFDFQPQETVPDFNRDFDGSVYLGPIAGAYSGGRAIRRLLIEPRR
jgi:hypothetical protein